MGIIITTIGAKRYTNLLLSQGLFSSFRRSLMASAKGTISPIILGLFGPRRMWIYPSTFRSKRVKKATATMIRIS